MWGKFEFFKAPVVVLDEADNVDRDIVLRSRDRATTNGSVLTRPVHPPGQVCSWTLTRWCFFTRASQTLCNYKVSNWVGDPAGR